jgi:hypothetical protein
VTLEAFLRKLIRAAVQEELRPVIPEHVLLSATGGAGCASDPQIRQGPEISR